MTYAGFIKKWGALLTFIILGVAILTGLLGLVESHKSLPASEHLVLADAFQAVARADYFADDATEPDRRHIAYAEAHSALEEARGRVSTPKGRSLLHIITLYQGELEKVPSLDTACAASRFPFFDQLRTGKVYTPEQAEAISKPFFACMLRRQNLDDNISVCRAQAWGILGGKAAVQPPYGLCDYRVNRLTPERR